MEAKLARNDEIRLIKIDEPAANIRYIGRSDSMRASDDEAVWQILRQHRQSDLIVSNYALMGVFKAKWSERTSYFLPAIPDNTKPLEGGVTINGSVAQAGLNIGGKVTEVILNDTGWTALPPVPLANRNSIQIQNFSGVDIKINYTAENVSDFGVFLRDSSERIYMIKDSIILYGRSSLGNASVIVEEIA
jgi:hypothetical protein